MIIRGHGKIVYAVWIALLVAIVAALFLGRWSMLLVSLIALILSLAPGVLADRFHISLPWPFFTGTVLFIFGSLFMGEVLGFYERYWWWDVALHGTSAIGFGLVGFVFVFALFEGDRYAAPHWAVAFISLCVAMTIGALWEVVEFTIDQVFGSNMQKSGLVDTMWDLIVDAIGASIAAIAGFTFLKYGGRLGLTGLIAEFVVRNKGIFAKFKRLKK